MRFENLPREAWIGLFVLFALATQNPSFFGLLFLVGMLMFTRSIMDSGNNARNARRPDLRGSSPSVDYDSEDYSRRSSRTSTRSANNRSPRVTVREQFPPLQMDTEPEPQLQIDHGAEAIRTAGLDPDTLPVRPVDLGMLVYQGNRNPEIFRTAGVPDDADFVRPFVELHLPRAAKGHIRFEILDSSGHSIFVDEASHAMKKGKQPIVAGTWLPVPDAQDFNGMWQLKISADGVLLANHVFEWEQPADQEEIRQHIQEDGEISPELRQIMAENRLQKMSLDELLADQDADDAAQKPSVPRTQKR